MKIQKITHKKTDAPIKVTDSFVDRGYIKHQHGSLPDVDVDFQSDRKQDVKDYLERRYNQNGKQRVFSAGTFTTLKAKAVIKDVARTMRISPAMVNYITAIIEDADTDYTDLFKLAATNRKIAKFMHDYPQLFESIRTLMLQPRSSSVHASALLITPNERDGEDVECFDFAPIKKIDGVLVSENSGVELDRLGLLKNDCLATKELSQLHQIFDLVNDNYNANLTMEGIIRSGMDEDKVFELLRQGYTQMIFQFSSSGMTKYLRELQPTSFQDMVAATALHRPATLKSGTADAYVDRKHGLVAPTYLWGTYNALKDTYGTLCLAEGTNVLTQNGQKRIEDINVGEMVKTHDGTFHPVLASFYKGRKETVIVRTSHGEELRCTPDHKVLTQHGWVAAGALIPRKHCVKGFWYSNREVSEGDLKDWCVGIYLANGTWGTTPTIACKNEEDAHKIAALLNSTFDLQCVVQFCTRCWYVRATYRPKSNKPNPFKEHLRALGLENKKSYDKNIPNMSRMCLSGFVEGDGSVVNGRIRIKNKKLAYNIFETMQALRVPSSIYETIEQNDSVWNISFLTDSSFEFLIHAHKALSREGGAKIPATYLKTVNISVLNKRDRCNLKTSLKRDTWCHLSRAIKLGAKVDHDVWGLVLSVKDCGSAITYDLSVNTNHSFVSGGLVTHNCYQEQIAQVAREVGGLSLAEGVDLIKCISKKKIDKIKAMKDKFMHGAKQKGCPQEDADTLWEQIEDAGLYCFNLSHATTYTAVSYMGAYFKAFYPTAFYTVALEWAKDNEIVAVMSEMEACSETRIVHPDINKSNTNFYTNYETNHIFWSLSRIKMLGLKAVDWIIKEREKNGEFTSIENFIERIFKYKLKKYQYWDDPDNEEEAQRCPVNARHVLHLILSGCFDEVEKVYSVVERYNIIRKAADLLGFEIKTKDFPSDLIDKHYFWSQQQIKVSGLGAIDYRRVYDNSSIKASIVKKGPYTSIKDTFDDDKDGRKAIVCATVIGMDEKSFVSKKTGETEIFCKLHLQQNTDSTEVIIWPEQYRLLRPMLLEAKNKLVVCLVNVKYSDFLKKNHLELTRTAQIEII